MALSLKRNDAALDRRVGKATLEYRAIFAVSFVIFFAAALIERLLPWRRRDGTVARSVLDQARAAAGTCTAYAFMG